MPLGLTKDDCAALLEEESEGVEEGASPGLDSDDSSFGSAWGEDDEE